MNMNMSLDYPSQTDFSLEPQVFWEIDDHYGEFLPSANATITPFCEEQSEKIVKNIIILRNIFTSFLKNQVQLQENTTTVTITNSGKVKEAYYMKINTLSIKLFKEILDYLTTITVETTTEEIHRRIEQITSSFVPPTPPFQPQPQLTLPRSHSLPSGNRGQISCCLLL